MANNESHVSLVMSVDGGQAQREIQKTAREMDKIRKLAGRPSSKGSLFDQRGIKESARGLKDLNRELKEALRTQRELDKLSKSLGAGGNSRGRLPPSGVSATAGPGSGGGVQPVGGVRGMGSAPNPRMGKLKGGLLLAASLAVGGLSWGWGQAQQGQAILAQHQAARAQTMAMQGGDHKGRRRSMVREGFRQGFSREQTHQLYQQMLLANGMLGREGVANNLQMMRGFGLSPQVLLQLQQSARLSGDTSSARGINSALAQALQVGEFPRALATELANASAGLVQMLGQVQERVSSRQVMGMISVLSKRLGGGFRGNIQRTAQLGGQLHNFIRNPGNETDQALMLHALSKGNPNANFFDLRRQQRQGLSAQNLASMLPALKQFLGSQDVFREYMAGRGFSDYQADRLWGMDTKGLTEKNIKATLAAKDPNIKGSAKQVSGRLGVVKRQIQMQEAQAAAAAKADKLLTMKTNMMVTAMDKITTALQKLGDALEWVLKKLGIRLGGKPTSTRKPGGTP